MIGVVFIVYYIYIKLVFGRLAFIDFFLYLGIILIVYNSIREKLKKNQLMYTMIKVFSIIVLMIFIIVESLMIGYPKNNIKDYSDYLIILGAAVKKDSPSLTLKARLDAAIEYLNKTTDDCYIVVSGGRGNDEHISEALAMKNYLVDSGISEEKIIMEDNSRNTYENFKYSKEKIEKHSKKDIKSLNIKTVTTDFHTLRSSILSKRNGYKNVTFYTSKSKASFIPVYYTREFFALSKAILFY
jgi:uncharacterized SAM-binding protein YcdF (DUF218 family)